MTISVENRKFFPPHVLCASTGSVLLGTVYRRLN